MSPIELHQFIPNLAPRDAVGNHTLCLRRDLAALGVGGEVWSIDIDARLRHEARPYLRYERARLKATSRRVLLYQAASAAGGIIELMLRRTEAKTIWYHNVTPASFFEPFDPGVAATLKQARTDLDVIAPHVDFAVADSEFNARELAALGIGEVHVVPPYLPASLDVPADARLSDWLRRTKKGIDIVFVGRVVPNKGHIHLLRALAALRSAGDPYARLFVVGGWGPDGYMRALFELRERLGLEDVAFTGSVPDPFLVSFYRAADVFLCLSEHEGFGLPLVEAMRLGVPVVAYDAGAVAETMGGTGIVLRSLDPWVVAETVQRLARDDRVRSLLVEGQLRRAGEIESAPRAAVLAELLGKTTLPAAG